MLASAKVLNKYHVDFPFSTHCTGGLFVLIFLFLLSFFLALSLYKQPPHMFYKKMFLKNLQNSQESTYAGVSFLIKLQTLSHNFFTEHLRETASLSRFHCLVVLKVHSKV